MKLGNLICLVKVSRYLLIDISIETTAQANHEVGLKKITPLSQYFISYCYV
jgi:hypothetical protein